MTIEISDPMITWKGSNCSNIVPKLPEMVSSIELPWVRTLVPPRSFRNKPWTPVPGVENPKAERKTWTPQTAGGGLKYAPTVKAYFLKKLTFYEIGRAHV